jgi:hypothetical protein
MATTPVTPSKRQANGRRCHANAKQTAGDAKQTPSKRQAMPSKRQPNRASGSGLGNSHKNAFHFISRNRKTVK